MRSLLITGALLLAASHAAADDFEQADRSLGSPTPVGVWDLDDGAGETQLAWDDYDPAHSYGPRGAVHWGLEGRIGAVPNESLSTSARPQFEIHGFMDVRYSSRSPWRLRLGIAVGAEPFESTNLGGGTFVTSSMFWVRLRVLPMSIDIGQNFGVRAGGDIGFQVAPGRAGTSVLIDGAGIVQLVGRSDDGRIEIGAYVGMRLTGVDRLERSYDRFSSQRGGASFNPDAVLGLSAGYLF